MATSSKKVLVVEDDPGARRVAVDVVAGLGFDAIPAPSVLQGLILVAQVWPDAIVLDFRMQPVDGITFLETVQVHFGRVPPVIVTTGYVEVGHTEDLTAAGKALGVCRVLTKPYNIEELEQALLEVLGGACPPT